MKTGKRWRGEGRQKRPRIPSQQQHSRQPRVSFLVLSACGTPPTRFGVSFPLRYSHLLALQSLRHNRRHKHGWHLTTSLLDTYHTSLLLPSSHSLPVLFSILRRLFCVSRWMAALGRVPPPGPHLLNHVISQRLNASISTAFYKAKRWKKVNKGRYRRRSAGSLAGDAAHLVPTAGSDRHAYSLPGKT
jgi:hypothetical protein